MPKKRLIITLLCIMILIITLSVTVCASVISEDELKTQLESRSKTEVSGNVFIWFLCAVAFLKISQKIDSFLSSLGINVGNTGGSMLGEAMVAAKIIKGIGKGAAGGAAAGGSSQGSGHSGGGFAPGTFANMVRRNPANNINASNNSALNQNAGNTALNTPSAIQANNGLPSGNNGNSSGALPGSVVPQLSSGGNPAAGQGGLPALQSGKPPTPLLTSGGSDTPVGLLPVSSSASQSTDGENSIGQGEVTELQSGSPIPQQLSNGEGDTPAALLPVSSSASQITNGENSIGQGEVMELQSGSTIPQGINGEGENPVDLSQPLSPISLISQIVSDGNSIGALSQSPSELQFSNHENAIDTLSYQNPAIQSADGENPNPIGMMPVSSTAAQISSDEDSTVEGLLQDSMLLSQQKNADNGNHIGSPPASSSASQPLNNENAVNPLSSLPPIPKSTSSIGENSANQGQVPVSQSESVVLQPINGMNVNSAIHGQEQTPNSQSALSESQHTNGAGENPDGISQALSHIPQISSDVHSDGVLPLSTSVSQMADGENHDGQSKAPDSPSISAIPEHTDSGNTVDISPASSSIPQMSSNDNSVGEDTAQSSSSVPQSANSENSVIIQSESSSVTQIIDGGNFVGGLPESNITGNANMSDLSADSFMSQMGYNIGQPDVPTFSNLQAGDGMITGIETNKSNPNGIEFGMYNASQYAAPEGNYKTIKAADNTKWYKQYAVDDKTESAANKTPKGNINLNQNPNQKLNNKKLPPMPHRKDKN